MVLINEVEIPADPLDYCSLDAVHCCTGLWSFLHLPDDEDGNTYKRTQNVRPEYAGSLSRSA